LTVPSGEVLPGLAALSAGLAAFLVTPLRADWRGRKVAGSGEQAPSVAVPAVSALAAGRVAGLLDLIASALDVGLAPAGALAAVAVGLPEPDRSRLRRALAMADIGGDATTVWRVLADDPVLGPLAQALERSERSGAPIAAAVRALADETRRESRAARLAAARRVGVRTAAPLGACFLPAFFLIAIVPTVIALVRDAL
jgi:pilus assembly protein TadC